MMLEELLSLPENKTLEFKENTNSLSGIIKTIVAFANTAGGTLVIGVEDKTKKVVGVSNILMEEERLTSAIADSITPLLIPNIEIQTFRKFEVIIMNIPHMTGPYFVKSAGPQKGVYVRFGSTNRVVDETMLTSMKLLSQNKSFDELPYIHEKKVEMDWDEIKKLFKKRQKAVNLQKAKIMGLMAEHAGKDYLSYGGIILFGKDRLKMFPDAIIRCARFLGITRSNINDQADIESYPVQAIDEAIRFIERNTSKKAEIGRIYRSDIPEYPPLAVREAIINAVLHADYSLKGSTITIAIFDDRMEITNPGGLVFNQTIAKALCGSSIIRNRVIAHTFRELNIIERWGSGLQRMIQACAQRGLQLPKFEEQDNQFRVTLYSNLESKANLSKEDNDFIDYLKKEKKLNTKEAAEFWKIAPRNALVRLKRLVDIGLIGKVGTSPKDPKSKYVLLKKGLPVK